MLIDGVCEGATLPADGANDGDEDMFRTGDVVGDKVVWLGPLLTPGVKSTGIFSRSLSLDRCEPLKKPKTPSAVKADAATTMLPPTTTITALVFVLVVVGGKRIRLSFRPLVLGVSFCMVIILICFYTDGLDL